MNKTITDIEDGFHFGSGATLEMEMINEVAHRVGVLEMNFEKLLTALGIEHILDNADD